MNKREYYNYENPVFAPLRDPMRGVVRSFWAAMQYYASVKEVVYGRYGMAYLSDAIHSLEHKQGDRIDKFVKVMRQQGLEVEYPGVPEMDEPLDILDEVFRVCIDLTNDVDNALQAFVNAANTKFPALARQVETLQMENSEDRTKLLECWSMWGNDPSKSSFDKWVKSRFDLDDDGGSMTDAD